MSNISDFRKFFPKFEGMQIVLENGRTFNTDDMKCPICGERMEIDESNITYPSFSLEIRPMERPFSGFAIDQRTIHNTIMRCPASCCKVEFDNHIVRNVGHMS